MCDEDYYETLEITVLRHYHQFPITNTPFCWLGLTYSIIKSSMEYLLDDASKVCLGHPRGYLWWEILESGCTQLGSYVIIIVLNVIVPIWLYIYFGVMIISTLSMLTLVSFSNQYLWSHETKAFWICMCYYLWLKLAMNSMFWHCRWCVAKYPLVYMYSIMY